MDFETAVPIGRGGMGEVAKAWDPTLKRPIALKYLINDTPEAQERMLREARAQARIDHPNICKVYDTGVRNGRAYIAMQFIEGRDLSEAGADLDLETKVVVMRTVAEAIQAAHAAGLIHRDLKPANILLEEDPSGEIRPYVVDFGIAREQEVAGPTMTGQVIGTPGYLAPEQARGETTTLDRRSDIFSLGVILYELLAGARPHEGDSDADALVSLLQDDPVPLRKRAPHVPRDLETIVMKCLEKDREKRYGSALQLADDLGRFLAGAPIEARAMTTFEFLVRRARQNPVATTAWSVALAVVLLSILALVGFWARYTIDLGRERAAALEAQKLAEEKERESTEVAEFLESLFEVTDPQNARGETITVQELLARGAERIETELEGEPLVQSRLMEVIARVQENLGLREDGIEMASKALEIRRARFGPDHPLVASSLYQLGQMHHDHQDLPRALEYLRSALEIQNRVLGPASVEAASTRLALANVLVRVERYDDAEKEASEAARILTAELGRDDRRSISALITEGMVLRARKDYEGATRIYDDVLERQRRLLGADHPDIAITLNNLGFALRSKGDFEGAVTRYREALALHEKLYDRGHPDTMLVLQNLASSLYLGGDRDGAIRIYREKVELERETLDENDWRRGSTLSSGLGSMLLAERRYEEAEPALREGLAVFESALGPGHSWTAGARGLLAACLFGAGEDVEATREMGRSFVALSDREELSSDNRSAIRKIAVALDAQGRTEDARRFHSLVENQ